MDQSAVLQLIELAEKILARDADQDASIELAEEYSEQFSSWFEANKEDFNTELDPEIVALIERLNDLHGKVLKLMTEWKTATVKDIQKHRQKGKGMMAYLDILPSKISVLKSRKG